VLANADRIKEWNRILYERFADDSGHRATHLVSLRGPCHSNAMNRRTALWLIILAAVLVCTFSAPAIRAQDRQEVVKVNGSPRTIQVHLPAGYSSKKRYPVVLVLHGIGGDASFMARISHFNKTADQFGFIVVYPNARDGRWTKPEDANVRSLGGFGRRRSIMDDISRAPGPNDVGGDPINDITFFSELLDQVESEYAVDLSRVYATGYSDGAFMDFSLGCRLPDRIAAIATVGALLPEGLSESCSNWSWRGIPLLMMNGTDDPVVPYRGRTSYSVGFFLLPAKESVREWAKMNNCGKKPERTTIAPRTDAGLETHVDTYSDCSDGAATILYTIEKGGHTWPGGEQVIPARVVGKTNEDIDASEIIWKFFAAHPMPARH
jgi:polyhydroxybutyrate depolymerase